MTRVLFLVSCLVAHLALARIVDPESAPNALLDSLAEILEQVDVRRGNPGSSVPYAPQLAPLRTLPTTALLTDFEVSTFGMHFEAGAFSESCLVAVDTGQPRAVFAADDFRKLWDASPRSKRVFVSFAGSDIEYAEEVRVALTAKGYTAFIYKNGSSKYPMTNAVEVGQYFRGAAHHLVIDTRAARKSKGVLIEARALHALDAGEARIGGVVEPSQSQDIGNSEGLPCCRLCIRTNGVTTCGAVQCGPQCFGAKPEAEF